MDNKTNNEKLKKIVNKKTLLGISSLLIGVLLIAVFSFVNFIIDPKQWQTVEFLTDELIICAIVIFSMVSVMFIAQSTNAQNINSNLSKARKKFLVTKELIKDYNGFFQWVRKKFQPDDIRKIKERILRKNGIEDFSVLDLEIKEIKSLLETPQKYNDKYYKGLSQEQINAVIKIKTKGIQVALVPPDYYLSAKSLGSDKTITERSSKEEAKKSLFLIRSLVGKVLLTVVVSMIFASLIKDTASQTAFWVSMQKFLSRIWSMCSSAFMGYLLGCQINDVEAEYIDMKVLVQEMFLQDKDFKPLNQQEEAKEEFIKRVKKEQVLALENNSNLLELK